MGTKIIPCGMDHSLNAWRIDREVIRFSIASDLTGDDPEAIKV